MMGYRTARMDGSSLGLTLTRGPHSLCILLLVVLLLLLSTTGLVQSKEMVDI